MSIHINFNRISKGFQHLPDQFKHIPDELQKAGLDPHILQEFVHQEFQNVIQSGAGEIAKQVFEKSAAGAEFLYNKLKEFENSHPELVNEINDVGISVSLSVLTLGYDNFYSRAEGLVGLLKTKANDFRLQRNNIIWILENTGPTTVDVNVSGELFSSLVSAGIGISVPFKLGLLILDEILEQAGVPA